jgi:hypothetical protein
MESRVVRDLHQNLAGLLTTVVSEYYKSMRAYVAKGKQLRSTSFIGLLYWFHYLENEAF